jgi:hypothetical protein
MPATAPTMPPTRPRGRLVIYLATASTPAIHAAIATPGCLWATVPDVVGDAEATDVLWRRWGWSAPMRRGDRGRVDSPRWLSVASRRARGRVPRLHHHAQQTLDLGAAWPAP